MHSAQLLVFVAAFSCLGIATVICFNFVVEAVRRRLER